MRARFSAGMWCRVRMLCSRSASLTSSTRTSTAMASRSLRKFSPCAGALRDQIEALDLGQPVDEPADLRGEDPVDLVQGRGGIFLDVSCSTAATMVASSSRRSVRMAATSSGWAKNGSPRRASACRAPASRRRRPGSAAPRRRGIVGLDPLDELVLAHHPPLVSLGAQESPARPAEASRRAGSEPVALNADDAGGGPKSNIEPNRRAAPAPKRRGSPALRRAGTKKPGEGRVRVVLVLTEG